MKGSLQVLRLPRSFLTLLGIASFTLGALAFSSCASFSGPDREAQAFLKNLHKDPAAAYDMTSLKFKQYTSEDAFTAFIEQYPHLTIVKRGIFEEISNENGLVILQGQVYFYDNQNAPMEISLLKGDNGWEVAGFNINPQPEDSQPESSPGEAAD